MPSRLIMRTAHSLTRAFDNTLHPTRHESPLPSHLADLLWYTGVMLVGAGVGTCGALVYSLAL